MDEKDIFSRNILIEICTIWSIYIYIYRHLFSTKILIFQHTWLFVKSVERCIDTNIQNGYSILRDRETSRNVSFHAGVLRAFCWAASFGCFDSPQFDGAKEKNAENLCRIFGKAFLKMPSSRSNKQFGKGKNDQKKSAPAESAECAFGCWNRPVELPVRLVAVAGRYQQGRTQRSARGRNP